MGRRLGLALLAVGAVAVLVAAASASPLGESRRSGTLQLMWGAAPDSLDPALANGRIGSWTLLNATCAKLFTTARDPETGRQSVVRESVRRWAESNGGRTYTFELKRTFRFHTGARVTARNFEAAFNRNANPLMDSVATLYMRDIIGADAAIQGAAKTISGVQVLDPYRLRIRLKHPAGDFIARLTMPYFCPILPRTPMRPINEPPGSGPYYFADHVPNRRIVLERNRYYGGGRVANPDRIVWRIELQADERLRATEQDENDFLPLFSQPDHVVRDLIDSYGLNRPGGQVLRDSKTLGNFLFRFNPDSPAFEGAGGAPLGKAINYALDRPAMVRAHPHLTVTRTDRLLPAALSARRSIYPLDGPDLATAQRWLTRAGQSPQTLSLYMWSFPGFGVRVAQEFASSLRQLGIQVDVTYFDLATLLEKVDTRGEPWDVAWLPWGAAYPDSAGALRLLRSTRHEARLNSANQLKRAARAKALAKLEAELMRDDPPVAAYAHFTPLAFVSRKMFGCWTGADSHLDLGAVCKK